MESLNLFVVTSNTTVIDAMSAIDKNATGTVYICDVGGVVKAAVSDGDIRRYILTGGDLNAPALGAANKDFRYIMDDGDVEPPDLEVRARNHIKKYSLRSIPIIDETGRLKAVVLEKDRTGSHGTIDAPVVIMAGGKGTRLLPFTSVLPKPLIPIGDRTVIEMIMDRFAAFGCDSFDVIINYKRNLIKAFFEDAENGYDVNFIEEEEYRGTGGGLSLLKGRYSEPFFMTNCDIVIENDYSEMIKHHKVHNNIITMVTAMKNIPVNYGTIEVSDEGFVTRLDEKPSVSMLVNTGLYIIEPRFLEYIPDSTFIHITDAIEHCVKSGERVGAYPVSEAAWLDMGDMGELARMQKHFLHDSYGEGDGR